MASKIIESYGTCYGADTYPIIPKRNQREGYLHRAVNRSTARLINDTRPPFIEMELKFQTSEEEYTFRNAAISGMKFYNGESSYFSPFLIVAVGDLILAGYIRSTSVEFFNIYKGIDPKWMFAFFCQALNILVYQNSKDMGLYWTGKITEKMKLITDSKYINKTIAGVSGTFPMVPSNVMTYAHGRIFNATSLNIVYASDFILSQGLALENREAVLCYSETTYPSSGDGFGSPAEMGQITGITTIPQSNTLNGHGDVIVTCRNGFFSISPNRKPRNEWTVDPEMQKNVLIGKGCVSHNSIVSFANQIFYRDSNGDMSSLMLDISNYQNGTEYDPISSPVDAYTGLDDNSPDIQFCESITTGKRMLSGIGYQREVSSHMGIHRYAMGIISSCIQRRDGQKAFAWEGLWTGPRMVASCATNINNSKLTIIASYDTDKQNRLYYISDSGRGDDFTRKQYRKIVSQFSCQGVFRDENLNAEAVVKTFDKIELVMVESNCQKVEVTYTTNLVDEHFVVNGQLTEIEPCGYSTIRYLSNDVCSQSSKVRGSTSHQGYFFGVNFQLTGVARVEKCVLKASHNEAAGFNKIECRKVKPKNIIKDMCSKDKATCSFNQFNYLF